MLFFNIFLFSVIIYSNFFFGTLFFNPGSKESEWRLKKLLPEAKAARAVPPSTPPAPARAVDELEGVAWPWTRTVGIKSKGEMEEG